MSAQKFITEFVKNWKTTGAVLPSSFALAEAMVRSAGIRPGTAVLELGPGTGPITEVIEQGLPEDAQYVGVEVNAAFCEMLRQRFPRMHFIHGGAQEVDLLAPLREGLQGYDCIISGLPWTAFPDELQSAILSHVLPNLLPGGRFVTFAYAGLSQLPRGRQFYQKLRSVEGARVVKTPIVWGNMPPAFTYVLTK
jgi:phosphatidylethanolamine/phosphatidyl-N-methylethanolamine N-methyltransferase